MKKKETVSKSIQEINENIQKLDLSIKELTEQKSKLELSKKELDDQHTYLSQINYNDFNLKCNQFDPISGIPTIEDANFDYCNDINNKLTSKENSYLIIFNFITDGVLGYNQPDDYLNNYIKAIIQNSYSKSENIILITTQKFTKTNIVNIQIIDTIPSNALNTLNLKIKEIIGKNKPNNNLTIYNMTHGNMRFYNTNNFITSAMYGGVNITIEEYFKQVLEPLYLSSNNFNVMIVNGNCFASYNIFKYVKKLTGRKNINLYTYSVRPYFKYLVWIRNFLHFVSKSISQRFKSASNDTDKFNIFIEAIDNVKNLLINKTNLNKHELENKQILLNSLSTEDNRKIITEIDTIKNIINPTTQNNIFELIKILIDEKQILQDDIILTSIDLNNDRNSDSFLNRIIEQGTLNSTNSYSYKILSDTIPTNSFLNYDTSFTIKQLNSKKDEIISWYLDRENWDSGMSVLRNYYDNKNIEKLIRMSFDEQKDILFIPIEKNVVKRETMRNVRLIDLL